MRKEQKNKFINDAFAAVMSKEHSFLDRLEPQDLRMADIYFGLIEEFEDRLVTELAELRYVDYDKVIELVLDDINLDDYKVLFKDRAELRMSLVRTTYLYRRWCLRNGFPARDDISRSKQVRIMKGSYTVVRSPEHLQAILDEHLDPIEYGTADLCCRGAAWLSYIGMTEDEVVTVAADAFHFKDKYVEVMRGETPIQIPLPEQSLGCLSALGRLDTFQSYRKSYKEGKAEFKRVESEAIIRGVDTGRGRRIIGKRKDASKVVINNIFTRHRKDGGLQQLGYLNLLRCGFFYRAYKEEQSKGEMDSIYQLEESQLGWETNRTVKRFRIKELDRLLEMLLASASAKIDEDNAGTKERYWRNSIGKEYTLWKQLVELKK